MNTSPVTFEALLDCHFPEDVVLTRAGDRVAFTVLAGEQSKDATALQQLWLGPPAAGGPQLVSGADGAALLTFSRDGKSLAFATERDGDGIMRLSVLEDSGDVRILAGPAGSVESISWSETGDHLLVLAADPGSTGAGANNWKQIVSPGANPDPLVTRPDTLYRRLFLVDVESGEATEVQPRELNIWEVGWNGVGRAVAIVSAGSSESDFYDASLALLDLEARTHEVLHEAEWQMQSPVISPDGQRVAVVEGWSCDRAPITIGVPTVVEVGSKKITVLDPGLDVQRLQWLDDGSIFYVGQAGLETMCGRIEMDATVVPIWQGPATLGKTHIHSASASADGRLACARIEGPGEPPEVMRIEPGETEWTAITAFNAELRAMTVPRTERVTWHSDGWEIEGILLTPTDREKKSLPLVIIAHGGPATTWSLNYTAGYEHLGLPLANHGYAVLLPNPRGSTGRGQEFARAHLGAYGPMDLDDFIAGIESLHEAGIVDRDRVGITGVSGGGYMSAYAATRSQAFKATVPKSCVSNWVSFHLTSTIGRFDEIVLQGDPYDPAGNHVRLSPVMHAPKASTPTLVLHGGKDTVCPLGQARELYQALVDADVETELVVYEQAGHVLSEREYLLDMWHRTSAWFDRHLRA